MHRILKTGFCLVLMVSVVMALGIAGCKKKGNDDNQGPQDTQGSPGGNEDPNKNNAGETADNAGKNPAAAPAAPSAPAAAPSAPAAAPAKSTVKTGKTDEKVKLEFYVMSQCPFGTQVEAAIDPVLDKMGANIDFHLEFIGNKDPNQETGYNAMHGQSEVKGNIWQLCAINHYAADFKYMDFILCQNKNMRAIPTNGESCAQEVGLDVAKMKACAEGQEGKDLFGASLEKAQSKKATGSPTIFLSGRRYGGGRTENDFMRSICNEFKGTRPEACANIPEPVKVETIVLTDTRCKACNSQRLVGRLKSLFPGLSETTYNYATDAGRAKYDEMVKANGPLLLPAILFTDSVKKGEGYQRVQRYLKPYGAYSVLAIGAKWDPTAEICDDKTDNTGNGKVDCEDPTCTAQLICRKEQKNKLDVFVMSQCPYGVRALNAMDEVLKNFGDDLDFEIHFINDVDPNSKTGFSSLKGDTEVRENIRELCAITHYPKNHKYMDYILCRNKNIRSENWQECAVNGIDVKVIEKCSTGGEGKTLLGNDLKLAKSLGISASPTWLANNKHKFSGVDAETIRKNICIYNPGLKNCDKKLSGQAPGGAAPAGACGK
ncbi:MAG: hypothetical protein CMH54_05380 [Myxococcales bacterium]|nr:hypothetical protein [Myxococcales bacterium]